MAETAELVQEKKDIRRIIDKLAPIYETKVWAPLIWRLFGGLCATSYWRMAEIVAEKTEIREGCSADWTFLLGFFRTRLKEREKRD